MWPAQNSWVVTKPATRVIPGATNKGINLHLLSHDEKTKVPARVVVMARVHLDLEVNRDG